MRVEFPLPTVEDIKQRRIPTKIVPENKRDEWAIIESHLESHGIKVPTGSFLRYLDWRELNPGRDYTDYLKTLVIESVVWEGKGS